MSKTSDDSGKVRWWAWLLLLPVVFVAWVGYGWILWISECFPELEKGQFGDCVWSTKYAVLLDWLLQVSFVRYYFRRRELELQQKELELQREELAGQKEQLKAQNQTLQKQYFESSFFPLLGLHNDIVNSMKVSVHWEMKPIVYQGRQCFAYLLDEFRHNYGGAEERFHAGMEGESG